MSSTVLRTSASTSTHALVVTSPATTTTPVLMRVSQATRPRGSSLRIESSTASAIWSATVPAGGPEGLSGCAGRGSRRKALSQTLLQVIGSEAVVLGSQAFDLD